MPPRRSSATASSAAVSSTEDEMTLRLLLAEQRPHFVGEFTHDTARLEGYVNPTGTIIFQLYGPDDDLCAGPPIPEATTQVDVIPPETIYRSKLVQLKRPG